MVLPERKNTKCENNNSSIPRKQRWLGIYKESQKLNHSIGESRFPKLNTIFFFHNIGRGCDEFPLVWTLITYWVTRIGLVN